jgi:hypothetical protein
MKSSSLRTFNYCQKPQSWPLYIQIQVHKIGKPPSASGAFFNPLYVLYNFVSYSLTWAPMIYLVPLSNLIAYISKVKGKICIYSNVFSGKSHTFFNPPPPPPSVRRCMVLVAVGGGGCAGGLFIHKKCLPNPVFV